MSDFEYRPKGGIDIRVSGGGRSPPSPPPPPASGHAIGTAIADTRIDFETLNPEVEAERLTSWIASSNEARALPAHARPPLVFPGVLGRSRAMLQVRLSPATDEDVTDRRVRVFLIEGLLQAESSDGEVYVLEIVGTVRVCAPYRGRNTTRVVELANVSSLSESLRQLNALRLERRRGESVTFKFAIERTPAEIEHEAQRLASNTGTVMPDVGGLLRSALRSFHDDAAQRFLALFEREPALCRADWIAVYPVALAAFGCSVKEQPWKEYVEESDLLIEYVEQELPAALAIVRRERGVEKKELGRSPMTAQAARVVELISECRPSEGDCLPAHEELLNAARRVDQQGLPERRNGRDGRILGGYKERQKEKWRPLGFEKAREVVYWMASNEADELERELRSAFLYAKHQRPQKVTCHCGYVAYVASGILAQVGAPGCPLHGAMRVVDEGV